MNEKERLLLLINNPKQPNLYDWVNEISDFIEKEELGTPEIFELIDSIEKWGDSFDNCEKLVSKLKMIYKKRYEDIIIQKRKKVNQIFIAMYFSNDLLPIYEIGYKEVAKKIKYNIVRIDEKEFTGSIIKKITEEIIDSTILIADLTGNRGGVYYEAGIAKGLQICNHPIKLVLTCQSQFFNKSKVHFDVSGDKIIIYNNAIDLKEKLIKHLNEILKEK